MVPIRSGAAPLHPTPPSAARLNQALGAIHIHQDICLMEISYTDKFTGSRYGKRTARGTPKGKELYEKFISSPRWKEITRNDHIEEKNDNRTDVYRGNVSIFEDVRTGKKVIVRAFHSNTGKTIDWVFSDEAKALQATGLYYQTGS